MFPYDSLKLQTHLQITEVRYDCRSIAASSCGIAYRITIKHQNTTVSGKPFASSEKDCLKTIL